MKAEMLVRLGLLLATAVPIFAQDPSRDHARIDLRQGWSIQSSAKVTQQGAEISTRRFRPSGWYPAIIPSTVVAALVKNNVYPDPYFGMNLRSIPGTTYGVGMNFANLPMPEDSPFRVAWWYRTEFQIPSAAENNSGKKMLWLNFDSINYRANIWLNGHLLANSEQASGMYRMFEFDITAIAEPGSNILAAEVFPPTPTDLGLTFVDWNPMTPDKEMGLVRDVYLLTSGPVALRDPFVDTHLDSAANIAHLRIYATLKNATEQQIDGTLKVKGAGIDLSKQVQLHARQTAQVLFDPADFPQLNIDHPNLWWPYPVGPQNLERLDISFESGGHVSDRRQLQFGIREITSEIDAQKHRLFKINGRN